MEIRAATPEIQSCLQASQRATLTLEEVEDADLRGCKTGCQASTLGKARIKSSPKSVE
jgi:hypothetical protein